jgi:predicted MFS family arabinose efflux permease
VTVLGALAVLALVPESRNPAPGKIDYLGVLASIVGLVLLVYGIVQGGDGASWISAQVLGPVVGGLAVLALFAWYETRIGHPSLDIRLFRDRRLSASVGAIAVLFFGMGGVYFFTSFYLQNVRGYTALEAGLLAVPFAIGQFITSPRSATLVNRYGARTVAVGGMLLNALAIAGYSFLGLSTPIVVLGVLFFVQGAGMGATVPTATTAVMDVLPRERAGAGSALTNTARQVAVALGVAVLGSILAGSYRSTMSPTLAALPAAARADAGQSVSATQAVAEHLGPAGRFLLEPGNAAFVSAMRVTTLAATAIAVLGALIVMRWLPGRPRPTIEELVAAEVAAAERDLATRRSAQREPSER